ncbi:MAG: cation:proton antiporter [Desulfobacteraceae bacterium]|nr:MAG: cation:proton antiporter [Desulfobacteraceae bacterium]
MDDFLSLAVNIAYIGLLISFLSAIVRMVLGPTHADRVLALDLIGFVTISFIATYTISSGQTAFLDIAITLALVAFLGTVAFVKFMKTRLAQTHNQKEDESWKS